MPKCLADYVWTWGRAAVDLLFAAVALAINYMTETFEVVMSQESSFHQLIATAIISWFMTRLKDNYFLGTVASSERPKSE